MALQLSLLPVPDKDLGAGDWRRERMVRVDVASALFAHGNGIMDSSSCYVSTGKKRGAMSMVSVKYCQCACYSLGGFSP